jgi:hypothetical protein
MATKVKRPRGRPLGPPKALVQGSISFETRALFAECLESLNMGASDALEDAIKDWLVIHGGGGASGGDGTALQRLNRRTTLSKTLMRLGFSDEQIEVCMRRIEQMDVDQAERYLASLQSLANKDTGS